MLVKFEPGWRLNLLKKTIDAWPRQLEDNDRLKTTSKFYFSLASYLLFSFFHTHVYAMTCGCRMSYRNSSDGLIVEYSSAIH